jgi:hypothetical protein
MGRKLLLICLVLLAVLILSGTLFAAGNHTALLIDVSDLAPAGGHFFLGPSSGTGLGR